MIEINQCEERYLNNRCDGTRVPAIRDVCRELDLCRARHLETGIQSSRVAAALLGETIEIFFSQLSFRTMGLFAILLAIIVGIHEYLLKRTERLNIK